jgi:hypothetical protein
MQSSRRKIFSPPLRGVFAFLPRRGGWGEWKRAGTASRYLDAIALLLSLSLKKWNKIFYNRMVDVMASGKTNGAALALQDGSDFPLTGSG